MMGLVPAVAQPQSTAPVAASRSARPTPPTRDPNTPGFINAQELPEGAIPPVKAEI
jgi:hypothetical protein